MGKLTFGMFIITKCLSKLISEHFGKNNIFQFAHPQGIWWPIFLHLITLWLTNTYFRWTSRFLGVHLIKQTVLSLIDRESTSTGDLLAEWSQLLKSFLIDLDLITRWLDVFRSICMWKDGHRVTGGYWKRRYLPISGHQRIDVMTYLMKEDGNRTRFVRTSGEWLGGPSVIDSLMYCSLTQGIHVCSAGRLTIKYRSPWWGGTVQKHNNNLWIC